jgi:hypothetical protein
MSTINEKKVDEISDVLYKNVHTFACNYTE